VAASFSAKADNALTLLKDIVVDIATLARPVTASAAAGLIITLIPDAHLTASTLAPILAAIGTADLALQKLILVQPPGSASGVTTRLKVDSLLTAVKNIVLELATLQSPVTAAAVAGFILTLIPGVGLDSTTLASVLVAVGAVDNALGRILPVAPPANPSPSS
jgi:hypothetical protein